MVSSEQETVAAIAHSDLDPLHKIVVAVFVRVLDW